LSTNGGSVGSGKTKRKVHPKRTGIVWSVFIGAMTLAGGALVMGDGWKGTAMVSVAQAESVAPIQATNEGGWTQIVVHESGSLVGSLEGLTRQHVAAGLPSLGYHFVIGNGNGELDGAPLTGPRWTAQQLGTHVTNNSTGQQFQNPNAIEICLIGDSRRRPLTDAQLESLASAVGQLSRYYGIDRANVVRQQDRGGPSSFGSDAEWSRIRARLVN
jgi:hypothetical protein